MHAVNECYFNDQHLSQEDFIYKASETCLYALGTLVLHWADPRAMFTLDQNSSQVVFNEDSPIFPNESFKWNISKEPILELCGAYSFRHKDKFCSQLSRCVNLATQCCNKQIVNEQKYTSLSNYCHATWDGVSCFDAQLNGSVAEAPCPEFFVYRENHGSRECLPHGEWASKTNYEACVANVVEHHDRLHNTSIICKSITISAVIPAILIMLSFRSLRKQQRIQVHVCLLLASLMVAVTTLMWKGIINQDLFDGDGPSILATDSVWCRLLSLSKRYSYLAIFMWMFIEFFHLHRLLIHAFKVPKSLRFYYIFGYGFPLLVTVIYGIVKASDEETSYDCLDTSTHYDWIWYAPNLLALVLNIVLMVKILFVLVRQLAPHPNEPSSFRRALKAVIIMMPLMGVQYVMFVWDHLFPSYDIWLTIHDMLKEILCSLHGAFIALVFCYLNREIQTQLKAPIVRLLRRNSWCYQLFPNRSNTTTMTTAYVTEHNRGPRDGAGEGGGMEDCLETPPISHTQESLIPLKPIVSPAVINGHPGDTNTGWRSNCSRKGGGLLVDDEVTHLDPDGHRQ